MYPQPYQYLLSKHQAILSIKTYFQLIFNSSKFTTKPQNGYFLPLFLILYITPSWDIKCDTQTWHVSIHQRKQIAAVKYHTITNFQFLISNRENCICYQLHQLWSNDLVVRALESQSSGSGFKSTERLQGRLRLLPLFLVILLP